MTLRAVCLYVLMGKLNKFITERKLQPRLIELRIADKVVVKQGSARIHTKRNINEFINNDIIIEKITYDFTGINAFIEYREVQEVLEGL